jgi:hypothetical protein
MRTTLRKHLSSFVQRRQLMERRSSKRIVPIHRTICLIPSTGDECMTALVHNISSTGVAVQADHAYAPGTHLRILLVNEAHTFSLNVELSVVRCLRMGDLHLIAGTFAQPLSHDEVVPFIV